MERLSESAFEELSEPASAAYAEQAFAAVSERACYFPAVQFSAPVFAPVFVAVPVTVFDPDPALVFAPASEPASAHYSEQAFVPAWPPEVYSGLRELYWECFRH